MILKDSKQQNNIRLNLQQLLNKIQEAVKKIISFTYI